MIKGKYELEQQLIETVYPHAQNSSCFGISTKHTHIEDTEKSMIWCGLISVFTVD